MLEAEPVETAAGLEAVAEPVLLVRVPVGAEVPAAAAELDAGLLVPLPEAAADEELLGVLGLSAPPEAPPDAPEPPEDGDPPTSAYAVTPFWMASEIDDDS